MGNAAKLMATQPEHISMQGLLCSGRLPVVIVVEDQSHVSEVIHPICDFLGVIVERISSDNDLAPLLITRQPMAVMAAIDALGQDGYHVMKVVASYDRDLPILLLTGGDPALAGAADAIEEIWGLSNVAKSPAVPPLGELVDFLFRAGQKGRCLGLMPA